MFDELTGVVGIDLFAIVLVIIVGIFTSRNWVLNFYKNHYVVVPPEQVHIVVGGVPFLTKEKEANTKRAFYSKTKSRYWYFDWCMTRNILPLEQIPITVDKTKLGLHDQDMIPFRSDVVAWLVIKDPLIAAERIGKLIMEGERNSNNQTMINAVATRLARDIEPMICATARSASLNKKLIEGIMKNRAEFAETVQNDLEKNLDDFGLHLTNLEILHVEDVETEAVDGERIRGVLQNLELQETKKKDTETRIYIAEKDREARISEAKEDKTAKVEEAINREEAESKRIETDKKIALAEQKKTQEIQKETEKANVQTVKAENTLKVGQAKNIADSKIETSKGVAESTAIEAEGQKKATITQAQAEKDKKLLEAEGWSQFKTQTGQADADATRFKLEAEASGISAKLLAEAEGTNELADAQKKMQDNALEIRALELAADVEIQKNNAMAAAVGKATTKIYAGGMAEVFGQTLSPAQGAGIGVTLSSIIENLDPALQAKLNNLLATEVVDKKLTGDN